MEPLSLLVALCSGWSAPPHVLHRLQLQHVPSATDDRWPFRRKQAPALGVARGAPKPARYDDDDDDDEEANFYGLYGGEIKVDMVESSTGRVLKCTIGSPGKMWEGGTFHVLYPADVNIAICGMTPDGLDLVEYSDEVLDKAEEALREVDIEMIRSPFVLTARGSGLPDDGDMSVVDEDDDEYDEPMDYYLPEDRSEEEDQAATLLAEIEHDDEELFVVRPNQPVMVFAKKVDDRRYAECTDEELDAVEMTLTELAYEEKVGKMEKEYWNLDDD